MNVKINTILFHFDGDYKFGDELTMCHRLCGLSTYGLKAHVREMSTLPKLTIGHDPPLGTAFLPHFYYVINKQPIGNDTQLEVWLCSLFIPIHLVAAPF